MRTILPLPLNRLASIKNVTYWVVGLSTIGFILVWLIPAHPVSEGLNGYAPLHTILEIIAVAIATVIFAIGWHARLNREVDVLALLAAGYLGVALLDTGHLLSFNGMPDWLTPSSSAKAIGFWFLARFMAAFTLLAFVYGASQRKYRPGMEWLLLAVVLIIVLISGSIVLWRPQWIPQFIVPGQGLTSLKIRIEWLLVLLNLGILGLVWRRRERTDLYQTSDLMASIWLTCLSELCFTLYSHAEDIFNLMGHVLKVLSYFYLYRAIVIGSIRLPYQMLSESRKIMQQLTDNISQVYWLTTRDKQKMLYVSPTYEKIWQRPASSLVDSPLSWLDSVYPEDRESVQQFIETQASGVKSVTFRIVRPDGSMRNIRSRSFPIQDENGEVQRIAGVTEDITDDIMARENLEKMERLLQQSQSVAHLGSWELDLEKNHLTWSDEVFRICGISPQEFGYTYESFLDLVHPDDRKLIDDNYSDSLHQNKDSFETTHRIIRKSDNEIRYVQEKYYHLRDEHGKVIRSLGTILDITEQKEAEKQKAILTSQLLQAQKMEAIGQLTGGIAHDFNNMLGAILGYAYLLSLFDEKNFDFDKQKDYIDEILTAGNRAKELISQMLIFGRLHPDAEPGEDTAIALQPVIKEVLQLLRQSIPSTIDISYQVENDNLSAIMHPVQLHQILMNLAINSRDATSNGYGQITIKAERCRLSGICDACHEQFDGEYVVLSVADTGEGIPEEIRPKIFDPFFSTKEVGKGTGMGLSVVHGMIHSHKGHVLIKSRPEYDGTIIQVLLQPASAEASTANREVPTEFNDNKAALKGIRVMVVDDEVAMSALLHTLLEHYGATTIVFNDPLAALAEFQKNPDSVDLVVTDETMPKLSGLDLSCNMLELRADLPIILCTGFSETVNEDIIRQSGVARLLYKPVPNSVLIQEIADLANRRGKLKFGS